MSKPAFVSNIIPFRGIAVDTLLNLPLYNLGKPSWYICCLIFSKLNRKGFMNHAKIFLIFSALFFSKMIFASPDLFLDNGILTISSDGNRAFSVRNVSKFLVFNNKLIILTSFGELTFINLSESKLTEQHGIADEVKDFDIQNDKVLILQNNGYFRTFNFRRVIGFYGNKIVRRDIKEFKVHNKNILMLTFDGKLLVFKYRTDSDEGQYLTHAVSVHVNDFHIEGDKAFILQENGIVSIFENKQRGILGGYIVEEVASNVESLKNWMSRRSNLKSCEQFLKQG